MRGSQFRSSLKKWPMRKASGPERHPFDSIEPITTPLTPKHPDSGCFADWFLHNRRMVGMQVFWRWQRSNPNNPTTHIVRLHFLEENWKYQMAIRTEDFDKLKSLEHSMVWWMISAELREGIVIIIKGKTYWWSYDRLWKITALLVTTWRMQWVTRESVGNTRLLPCAKLLLVPMNFFSSG